jgi:hypothetical protein
MSISYEKFKILSVYTDSQAVRDGVLVDISSFRLFLNHLPLNRITGNLYAELMKYSYQNTGKLRSILRTKISYASMPNDGPQDGYFYLLPPNLWAVQNEIGGYTLMLPEDY